MIRIFFIFLLLLAAGWLGIQLHRDPGYLLIAVNHWTIESTVWVAFIGLVLSFLIFHAVLLVCHWIVHLPSSWHAYLKKRRLLNAQAKTRQGLIEFSEGYWLQAKNHLIKALPDTDTPLLNYLTAARAAQEMGDHKLRDDYLREAQQSMPDAKIAVELTQAQLQLANKQWEQALATLRHLQDLAPHHPYVLKLLMHLYEEVKDWPQLISLLPDLKHNNLLSGHEYLRLQHQAYLQAMIDLIKQDQAQALSNFIAALPRNLNQDPTLMAEYTRYLAAKHQDAQAEAILRRCLKKQFSDELITIYGQLNTNETQLSFAESLLKDNPHSAALFLTLGLLCQHQHLWGKAKINFEKSIEYGASPAAYLALGKLLEELGDAVQACLVYRQGLMLTDDYK